MGKPTPRPAAGLLMWQASPLDHVGSRIFVVACHQVLVGADGRPKKRNASNVRWLFTFLQLSCGVRWVRHVRRAGGTVSPSLSQLVATEEISVAE